MTTIYLASDIDFKLIGNRLATPLDMDLIDKEKLLTGRLTTLIEPLPMGPNECNVLIAKDTWELQSDYVGYIGYDADNVKHEITEIGIEPDSAWTATRRFILSDAQAVKIAEINASTKLVIVSGFTSDALGTSHLYQSEQEDQLNLAGIAGNGQDRVFKCSGDDGVTWSYQMHTAAQLNQVASDGIDFKTAALVAGETLKAQVRGLTNIATQADIDAIE